MVTTAQYYTYNLDGCNDFLISMWKKLFSSGWLFGTVFFISNVVEVQTFTKDISSAVGGVDDDMGSPDPDIVDSDGITTDKPSVEREAYEEVKLEKDHAAKEMKAPKAKMAALSEALKAVDIEMEELESSVKNNAQAMHHIVNAPW
jgi:hypothetical protein